MAENPYVLFYFRPHCLLAPPVLIQIEHGVQSPDYVPLSMSTPLQTDQPLRCLLVDDDFLILTLLGGLLKEEGFLVELASSGEEAVRKAAAFSPALILMDIQMPGMDGIEATKHIRRLHASPPPIIIAVTHLVDQQSRRNSLDAGMDGVLTKPFTRESLLSIIRGIRRDDSPSNHT